MDAGKLLRNRREELGYTLEYIAQQLGVTRATVSRWETGQIAKMKSDKIKKLADVLQISPVDIIDAEATDAPTKIRSGNVDPEQGMATYEPLQIKKNPTNEVQQLDRERVYKAIDGLLPLLDGEEQNKVLQTILGILSSRK